MRNKRHEAILTLIKEQNIETQQDLTVALASVGFDVTQATVSRDIKELRLVKKLNVDGKYVYAPHTQSSDEGVSDKMSNILRQSIVSVDYALNTIVIKTLTGMAQGAASVLDAMQFSECLGTIAGDDTIFVTARSEEAAQKLTKKLKNMGDYNAYSD